MEKLQALLVHRFWLLFGAVLLVPIVGWWIASGSLSSKTAAATDDIKAAKNALPAGVGLPNSKYVEGAEGVTKQKQALYDQEFQRLWDRQKALMTWPVGMESMSRYDFEASISDADRLQYQLRYNDEVERIRELLPEYDPQTEQGIVLLEGATLPFVDTNQAWRGRSPSSQQAWDAQMDNWFTEAIFKAIRSVNGTVEGTEQTIRDAAVRQITTLIYKGGSRGGDTAVAADPANMEGQPEGGLVPGGVNAAFDLFGSTTGGGGGRNESFGGSGGGNNVASPSNIDVDPAKIFGDARIQSTTDGTLSEGNQPAGPLGAFGGNTQQNAAERRYIDDDETLPYRTRGFYLHVVVRNDAVPDLLLALSNMDWPTTIVHVHVAEAHPARLERANAGGAFEGGGGGGGFERPGVGGFPPRAGLGGLGGVRPRPGGEGSGGTSGGLHTSALGPGNGLAQVVIAGVMTIYNEPKKEENAESTESSDPGTPESAESSETTEPDDETPANDPDADPAETDTTDRADATTPVGTPADEADSDPADAGSSGTEPADATSNSSTEAEPTDGGR